MEFRADRTVYSWYLVSFFDTRGKMAVRKTSFLKREACNVFTAEI